MMELDQQLDAWVRDGDITDRPPHPIDDKHIQSILRLLDYAMSHPDLSALEPRLVPLC